MKSLVILIVLLSFSISAWAGNVTLQGQVNWTDDAGGIHPVRFVQLQFWDIESLGSARSLGFATTGADGRYRITFQNDDGVFGGGIDLVISLHSRNAIYRLQVDQIAAGNTQVYTQNSSQMNNIADGTHTYNFRSTGNINAALSILDALLEGVIHARKKGLKMGRTLNAAYLRVYFPTSATEYHQSTKHINIAAGDEFEWDDIIHEFGHHVADMNNIAIEQGAHWLDQGITKAHGKLKGNRLALSEGFAHFFSMSTQYFEKTSVLKVPRAGDLVWSEEFSIESNEVPDRYSFHGEDSEVAVARTLWDLMDSFNEASESIAEGEDAILAVLKGSDNISDVWNKIITGKPLRQQLEYARVFQLHGISPRSDSSSDKILAQGAHLKWQAWGTRRVYHLDKFKILFVDPTISQIVFQKIVPPSDTQVCSQVDRDVANLPLCTYSLTQDDVSKIQAALRERGLNDQKVLWIVQGYNDTYVPKTGEYLSQPQPLGAVEVSRVYIPAEAYEVLLRLVIVSGRVPQWKQFYDLHWSAELAGILAESEQGPVLILPEPSGSD